MEKFYEKELDTIPFSRLSKLEVPRFALRVIDTIDKHDPEKLKIKDVYELLVAKKPQIRKLTVPYGPNPINVELKQMRAVRSLNVSELSFHLKKVMARKETTKVDTNVILVTIELNRFFDALNSSRNEESVNQKITAFYEELMDHEELMDALTTLGFSPLVNDLKVTHNAINELIGKKQSTISERPEEKTEYLKNSVLFSLKKMFKQIDVAISKHPEVDYNPFFADMNVLLNEYRVLINKRILFNKRKAELKKAAGQIAKGVSANSAVAAMMMDNLNEETTQGNGFEEILDQKKTAATSAKQVQLPSMDEEA